MPDPTREQFDAAAKRVAASAPSGLTKEQFYDRVQHELESSEGPSTAGFVRNAIGSAADLATGIPKLAMRALSQSPAKTAEDVAGGVIQRGKQYLDDMHPVDAAHRLAAGHPVQALGSMLPVGLAYKDPVGVAADLVTAGEGVRRGAQAAAVPGHILRGRQASAARGAVESIPEGNYDWHPEAATDDWKTATNPEGEPETPFWDDRHTYAPDPSFAPATEAGEAAANAGRGPDVSGKVSQEDSLYNELIKTMGGHAPAPATATAAPTSAHVAFGAAPGAGGELATNDEWHSGASTDTPEGRTAASSHQFENEMDQGYRNRLMDERGSLPLDMLGGAAADELIRKFVNPAAARPLASHVVRSGAKFIPPVAGAATDAALISRFINGDSK